MFDLLMNLQITDVIAGVLILVSLWIIKIIIRKEKEHIIRGLSLFLIFTFGLIYLSQSPYRNITVGQIMEPLFPQKVLSYQYHIEKGSSSQGRYIRYVFDPPQPRLKLEMAENGKHLHISNPRSLNRVLKYLELPPVRSGAPELASLTGSAFDANLYQWPDYPRGRLTATRGLCQIQGALETYHCLIQITIITHPY